MSVEKSGKRNLFAELMEGVDAMGKHREGKVTLRTHRLPNAELKASPGAEFFVAAREKFNVSRAAWANMLRVSSRTVEKWEQGGQASPLAATFVELVVRYPDTIERLQALPRRVSKSFISQSEVSKGISVRELFKSAGLSVCGPVRWNDKSDPVREMRPGVYVVAAVASADDAAGLDFPGELEVGLAARWVASQPVLYIGQTTRPLSVRIGEFYRHRWGKPSPHRGGQDVKLLGCPLWVYWSPTEDPGAAEYAMIEKFMANASRLPFGNRVRPSKPLAKPEAQAAYA